eukprot:14566061-Ditylum_brightwellii.AAC.1
MNYISASYLDKAGWSRISGKLNARLTAGTSHDRINYYAKGYTDYSYEDDGWDKASDIAICSAVNKSNIQLEKQNGPEGQIWKLVDSVMVNPNSGKALDVAWDHTRNGSNIHLQENNGTGTQNWVVMADGTIVNSQFCKALDVSEGGIKNETNI